MKFYNTKLLYFQNKKITQTDCFGKTNSFTFCAEGEAIILHVPYSIDLRDEQLVSIGKSHYSCVVFIQRKKTKMKSNLIFQTGGIGWLIATVAEQLTEKQQQHPLCEWGSLGMEEKHCDKVVVVVVLIHHSRSETFFASKWETGRPGALQLLQFPPPLRRLSCYCGCCMVQTQWPFTSPGTAAAAYNSGTLGGERWVMGTAIWTVRAYKHIPIYTKPWITRGILHSFISKLPLFYHVETIRVGTTSWKNSVVEPCIRRF